MGKPGVLWSAQLMSFWAFLAMHPRALCLGFLRSRNDKHAPFGTTWLAKCLVVLARSYLRAQHNCPCCSEGQLATDGLLPPRQHGGHPRVS